MSHASAARHAASTPAMNEHRSADERQSGTLQLVDILIVAAVRWEQVYAVG
jgi:hypothetical protein